jgi:hypothetical protein
VDYWLGRRFGKRAYDKFFNLRKLRNRADYDLPPSFRTVVVNAEMALGIVKELMRLF